MSSKPKVAPGSVITVETGWTETVLICRKCSKKMNGGYGEDGKLPLRSALRERLREAGQRRSVRIIETGCFGVCPKKAVTVCRGSAPGRLLVLGAGAELDLLVEGPGKECLVP